ncbi:MAG: ferritin-like domain-containing protein [Acidimicrobiales bacterium]|nr:ferritin-like domain-containing protein [Acidimicrobiales bacterium]
MTTTEPNPSGLPDQAEVDDTIKLITDNATRVFSWKYDRERDQLVTLYNKAMASQWDSIQDLDWSIEVDPEQLVKTATSVNVTVEIAKAAKDVDGSPFATWGDKEFTDLGIESMKASLSQFMHGEQGAMMVAAKIVETVPWIDAKYYAATQTMDEARHTEVFAKYLDLKLGEAYPMSPYLDAQIQALIEDSRWDIAYLGMQIIIESLALAAFGSMLRSTQEPLLKKLLRYVLSDEARHVAFGILSLAEYYENLSEAELLDRQEFMAENTLRSRNRSTTPEVWERMGVDFEAAIPALREGATKIDQSLFTVFQRGFYSKLVPNTRKLGLLDANNGHLRKLWGDAGLLEWEFADSTADDYDAYDAVAEDRAAAQ